MTVSVDSPDSVDIAALIEHKLAAFEPQWLQIENESHRHNVPPNAQTHFKVTLVSSRFERMMPVKRHQQIYAALADELAGPVHALALHLYTPEEWQARGGARPDSPDCRGGGR
ncbi:BolA family protein [Kushneria aurantia]|uniref:BolA family protein n=1 Tax=Kushneria aurantia TaxID=504092 RepID=A0ABV6G5E1_9GAMM|nr:BolA/IbaG family iron-sulfur metabolism protein [Kushneria aurantia]